MPQYVIGHAYKAMRDGQALGPWRSGECVELSEADAAWLNIDSPGVVVAVVVEIAPPAVEVVDEVSPVDAEVVRQQPPARDRQAKSGRNRGA